ncbi:MAG: TauD/TfdA family dioxygenase [Gammaproteobacteria bacterium]|nr:TauD/TfdA family dioxygenase [Gammaproteobacteria bacterium]
MSLHIEPIAGALGAEVSGLDLAAPLDPARLQDLRQALLDHQVLIVRDQDLQPAALRDLGRRFGDLVIHPNLIAEGEFPEVITIRKTPKDRAVVGGEWHTDTTCLANPPMGAILHARILPPVGGDTLFASQYLAYETLSDGMKRMLEGLRAVHNDTRVAGPGARLNARRASKVREDDAWRPTESLHPVIRTHPETGRRSLFVNIAYTRRFENMTEAESEPLLEYLYAHATRPEFTCRIRWSPGAVVFWDNRCLMHIALNDYPGHTREMIRVQIVGDRPH